MGMTAEKDFFFFLSEQPEFIMHTHTQLNAPPSYMQWNFPKSFAIHDRLPSIRDLLGVTNWNPLRAPGQVGSPFLGTDNKRHPQLSEHLCKTSSYRVGNYRKKKMLLFNNNNTKKWLPDWTLKLICDYRRKKF